VKLKLIEPSVPAWVGRAIYHVFRIESWDLGFEWRRTYFSDSQFLYNHKVMR